MSEGSAAFLAGRRSAAPPGASTRTRAWLLALVTTFGLAAGDTTVILLRHAEKLHRGDRAELSQAGRRRASALPAQLLPYQPAALFASNLKRTQQTLEPLATALSMPVQIYDRGEEWALGQRILVQYPDRTVVVCGHSDTLRVLVESLGCPAGFPEVSGYDRYWVVRVADSGAATLREQAQRRPATAD